MTGRKIASALIAAGAVLAGVNGLRAQGAPYDVLIRSGHHHVVVACWL